MLTATTASRARFYPGAISPSMAGIGRVADSGIVCALCRSGLVIDGLATALGSAGRRR